MPPGLTVVVVHPNLEIETARARALLGDTVPLADAIRQWANLGAFVDGLHKGDFAQISRSLEDTIAEPRRASLVPGLSEILRLRAPGLLGCTLSGAGPGVLVFYERGYDSVCELVRRTFAMNGCTTTDEVRAMLAHRAIEPLREQATAIGTRAASQGAAMVAIIPSPALEGLAAGLRSPEQEVS